ncbi:MAG: hypothetical protein WCR87_04850 [Saccharofermentanales bacterium]
MNINKEKTIGIVIIVVSVILTVTGFILLPETLIVQIGLDGQASGTMQKIPALLIPMAISTVFSALYMKGNTEKKSRNLIVAVIGIVIVIIMFVVNRNGVA